MGPLEWLFGYDVFISYSRKDGLAYAQALARRLAEKPTNLHVFFDQWASPPEGKLPLRLLWALRRSRLLVLIATPGALDAPGVTSEIETFSPESALALPSAARWGAWRRPFQRLLETFRRRRTVIPIALGPSLERASWYHLVKGAAAQGETDAGKGGPSDDVVALVLDAAFFLRRNERVRLTLMTFSLALVSAALYASVQGQEAILQRVSADQQTRVSNLLTRAATATMSLAQQQERRALESAHIAKQQEAIALSRALAGYARREVLYDSERAVLIGLRAAKVSATAEALSALRQALAGHHLLLALDIHGGGVVAVAFAERGKKLLSASGDGTLDVRDTVTGALLSSVRVRYPAGEQGCHVLAGRPNDRAPELSSAEFSADGTRVVTSNLWNSCVVVWDVASGAAIYTLPQEAHVIKVHFDPEAESVITAEAEGTAHVHDFRSASARGLEVGRGAVTDALFSPDGRWIATTAQDGKVVLWSAGEGFATPHPLEGHRLGVIGAGFSRDSRCLVTTSNDLSVRVWDLSAFRLAETVDRGLGRGAIHAVAFSPGNWLLATGGYDTSVRLWQLQSCDAKTMARPHRAGEANQYDRFLVDELRGHPSGVASIAFSPDGARLVTGGLDGVLRVWEPGVAPIRVFREDKGIIRRAAISADGLRLVTAANPDVECVWGGMTGLVSLWDLRSGVKQRTLDPQAPVCDVAFTRDGNRVLTAGGDGILRIRDAATGETVRELGDAKARTSVLAVSFGRRDQLIAGSVTGREGNRMRLWNERASLPLKEFAASGYVYTAALSSDGERLLSAGRDTAAVIWDSRSGRVLRTLPHPKPLWGAALSHDGRFVATASEDGIGRIWDWRPTVPRIVRQLAPGRAVEVRSVAFSPDDKWIVTGHVDGAARVWDVATGELVVTFKTQVNWVDQVAFTPTGHGVLSVSFDGTVKLYQCSVCVPAGELLALARSRVSRDLTEVELSQLPGQK